MKRNELIVTALALFCLCLEVSGNDRQKRQGTRVVFPEGEEASDTCTAASGGTGDCRHLTACLFEFEDVDDIARSSGCEAGMVCCPRISSRSSGQSPVRITPRQGVPESGGTLPRISSESLNAAGIAARQQIAQLGISESRSPAVAPGTAEFFHLSFFGNSQEARSNALNGLIALKAFNEIVKNNSLSSVQSRNGLPFRLNETILQDNCPPRPRCPSTKYRTINGTCNNLANPTWGQSFTAFQRLLPNAYTDGFNAPRISVDGGPLPSPREVSTTVAVDRDNPMRRFTNLFQQYGQFVDHDITLAAVTRAQNGSGILCCSEAIRRNASLRHEACMEIEIPANDPFYAQFRQTCMNFVRSAPAPRESCTFGPREQMNQLTSYMDGSQIYGSTGREEQQLRSFTGGRLRVTRMNGGEYLLQQNTTGGCAIPRTTNRLCFRAGDVRVNENVLLTVLQTIFLREHNRIADELARINPGWTDEILFQEARRIVGAELQHITYNEFLPLLLGRRIIAGFRLLPLFSGFLDDYDPRLNAQSINAFSAAAYRLGHSMVQGVIELRNERRDVTSRLPLSTQFNNPELLYERGGMDSLMRGMTIQTSQRLDSMFTDELTNKLFRPRNISFGLDLVSLNIQRGRDHGLPPYNEWRERCGLRKLRSFDEFANVMPPESARAFSRVYRNVDDVDLFIGGASEFPVEGSVVGPTFACIIAEQFRRYKFGDRFWYENGGMESSFTEAQLNEIRKVSLARIICDNSDNITMLQPLVFIQPARWNPLLPCNSRQIPRMDFRSWRNEPVWSG